MIQQTIELKKIAGISIILYSVLYWFATAIVNIPTELMLYKTGTVISIVSAFWLYFDRIGWRQNAFCLAGWLCDIPDLNGRWEGKIDRVGESSPHLFVMEIVQTYRTVTINTYTENSRGVSTTTNWIIDSANRKYQLYTSWKCQANIPGTDEPEHFHGFSFCHLSYINNQKCLESNYFTDRNPRTKGNCKVVFVSKSLQGGYQK